MNEGKQKLRNLPAVETILKTPEIMGLLEEKPRLLVLDAVHAVLDRTRAKILSGRMGADEETGLPALALAVRAAAEELERFHLRPLVNATGVVIHTNLGRSLLSRETMAQVAAVSSHYSNLEYELEAGERGSRYSHVEAVLCRLCGSEAALVVNNNAAAVLLGLNTLAEGREVIVSRGQLVEIGGSFRIPDVIRKSGCVLVDVGTTNKTHPKDYRNAITGKTACLLKVHTSNFEMRGFTREVSGRELAEIAREHGLPLMEDLGSGSLVDLSPFGLRREPTVQESLAEGVDLVTFSGDKLLGGPQAGILVGRKEILDRIKKNPLTRALRVDKMTLSALEATLRILLDPEEALRRIPTLSMLTTPISELQSRAERLAALLREQTGDALDLKVAEDLSQVGGGALPESDLPTFVVSLRSPKLSVNALERAFRSAEPPVIGRIRKDRFHLDVRTIQEEEFGAVAAAARTVAGAARG